VLSIRVLEADEQPDFFREIRPILSNACFDCHGPDAEGRQANLRLDQRVDAFRSKVLSSGEMLRRLQSDDPDVMMPPPESIRSLSAEQRDVLQEWLKAGAAWPEDDRHWSFIPPKRPEPPVVHQQQAVRNPIDAFVIARLERGGLRPVSYTHLTLPTIYSV